MPKLTVTVAVQLDATPDRVLAFLRDYRYSRPRILTTNYSAYRVEQGGRGDGTIYAYHFVAGRRERDYRLHVLAQDSALDEADQMSSFRSVWSVEPAPDGARVTLESSWNSTTGPGGWFERLLAPRRLRRIYAQMLEHLRNEVSG